MQKRFRHLFILSSLFLFGLNGILVKHCYFKTSTNVTTLHTYVLTTLLVTTRPVLMSAIALVDSLGMDLIAVVNLVNFFGIDN